MSTALPLVSYKIRFADMHVRAMPARTVTGAPFSGPGVDLRGRDALLVIEAARPILAWLDAREPGVVVRSISVRAGETPGSGRRGSAEGGTRDGPRVLVSLAPAGSDPRPRAMRFDPPYATELRDAASAAEHAIGAACARALERRLTSRA